MVWLGVSWLVVRTLAGTMVRPFSLSPRNPRSYGAVPLVILETTGSNCVYQSIALNRDSQPNRETLPSTVEVVEDPKYNIKLAHLTKLSSRASSLGASIPSAGVIKMALERKGGVKCVCGPDELAMQAALSFAGEYSHCIFDEIA